MQAQHIADAEQVRLVIGRCLDALRAWDRATLAEIFATDADAIHFGTAADEKYVGGAAYLQAMERTHTVTLPDVEFAFLPGSPVIQAREATAWVVGDARISGSLPNHRYFQVDTRITFILEKRDDGWKIVHSHYSIGVPGPA